MNTYGELLNYLQSKSLDEIREEIRPKGYQEKYGKLERLEAVTRLVAGYIFDGFAYASDNSGNIVTNSIVKAEAKIDNPTGIVDCYVFNRRDKYAISVKNYSKPVTRDGSDIFKLKQSPYDTRYVLVCNRASSQINRKNDFHTILELEDILRVIPHVKFNHEEVIPLYPHQKYAYHLAMDQLNDHGVAILGLMPRSGKTYIMNRISHNYDRILIYSPYPRETFPNYHLIFEKPKYQISEWNNQKGVILASHQWFANKALRFKKNAFDIMILDEPHWGGISKKTKRLVSNLAPRILYVTATPEKISKEYDIEPIGWDHIDVHNARNTFCDETEYWKRLDTRNPGFSSLIGCSRKMLNKFYESYPRVRYITWDFTPEFWNEYRGCSYGFSPDSALLMDKKWNWIDTLMAESFLRSVFYFPIEGAPSKKLPLGRSMMVRAHNIISLNPTTINAANNDCRIILCFISGTSEKEKNVMRQSTNIGRFVEKEYPQTYDVIHLSGRYEGKIKRPGPDDPVEYIEKAWNKCQKPFLLVLTHSRCTTGVSLRSCDIVIHMDNHNITDTYIQRTYRCATERKDKSYKKWGVSIDCNPARVVAEIKRISKKIAYDNEIYSHNAIRYGVEQDLICIGDLCTSENEIDGYETIWKMQSYDYRVLSRIKTLAIPKKYKSLIHSLVRFMIQKKDRNTGLSSKREDSSGSEPVKSETSKRKSDGSEENEDLENLYIILFHKLLANLIATVSIITLFNSSLDWKECVKSVDKDASLLEVWFRNKAKGDYQTFYEFVIDLGDISDIRIAFHDIKSEMVEAMKTCSITERINNLSKLIDEHLIPTEKEKRTNAEITTPQKLRKQMLDILPKRFWKKPRRVFEPCCGKGGFVIDLIARFMEGLAERYPDEKERYEKILGCICFADINPINVKIVSTILDPEEEYHLKSYVGDTLKITKDNMTEAFGYSEFNLVVGNPPYNTDPGYPGNKPLYNHFSKAGVEWTTQYLLYVIPARWFVGGKGLVDFRRWMQTNRNLSIIEYEPLSRNWFPRTDIMGGVLYYLIDKRYDSKYCAFNGERVDIGKYDIVIQPKHYRIVDKVKDGTMLNNIFMTRNYYKIETNDKRFNDSEGYRCYVSLIKSKSRIKLIECAVPEEKKTWKVITTEANGSYPKFGYSCISNPEEVYCNSYIGFRCKSEDEAKSLLSYLQCRLPNYLLSIRKISQHISSDTVKWIPLPPLDRVWTDEEIMEYYNIREDELV